MIDLSKTAPLTSQGGATPTEINLNVTYTVAQGKGFGARLGAKFGAKLDLDALLLLFNSRHEVVSVCGPEHLSPFASGAVRHLGDAKAGNGGQATETITVQLPNVPQAISGAVLAVVAYGNAGAFSRLAQLTMSVTAGPETIAEDYLTIEAGVQGQMLVTIDRDETGGWAISPFPRTIGAARGWEDVASAARDALRRR